MSARPRAAHLLGTVLALMATMVVLTAPAQATLVDPEDPPHPVDVVLDELDPPVLEPGQDLRVHLTLTNTGATTLEEPRVVVHLDRGSFISRSSLDRWRGADPEGPLGAAIVNHDLDEPLDPGASVEVVVDVPATTVGLRTGQASWGPRGLGAQVVDVADPARARLGVVRTFLVWLPVEDVGTTYLSVATPLVGARPDGTAQAWVDELETLTGPEGRLRDVLTATAEHTGVTWVVDPWLVDATSGSLAGVTQQHARRWALDLLDAAEGHEVDLLPYTDPDVAALAHAGAWDLLDLARDHAAGRAADGYLPPEAVVSVAWPVDPLPDLATAAFVGADPLVVAPGALPTPGILTYTPTGRTTITAQGRDVTVLTPDLRLSRAVQDGSMAWTPADDTTGTLSPAAAAQDLLAETAVITRERPADPRHLLVTTTRDWHPDPAVTRAQLTALEAAPWVVLEPLGTLVGASDAPVDRGTLPERMRHPAQIPADQLALVSGAVDERERYASMLEDPETLLAATAVERLAPASAAWREDPVGRSEMIARTTSATATLRDSVTVVAGGPINLISPTGDLRLRVTNAWPEPVTVRVGLRPDDSRLRADTDVEVTVPGSGETTAAVPVHGIQTADVVTTVELRTPTGDVIDDSTVMTVRVRAEWEGIGTAVIGVLLGLGLVIGVIRTVRRGRTGTRAEPQSEAGPDDLSPEEGTW
ncbi:DUF6049 family protein [Cellulomonas bogoriensis]|uniref:Glycoprotein n=1 Tax=Cellulomonas bogoriensis 69B4 = DSM 16987 TaxID=1386082 RepID=A0A0A0BYQ0_9CELL|nr:DUF6049 family protein [Cellulomonas bogoriensis]KGM13061.1 hypothetical protein N869_16365 [Cellulomonas bogoriensis 69B4 = DSM 16987]